ncbi:hypothetical protein CEXT_577601 [Caerostris extrusa]|uniref:Uncharacterized protein n=1 Tax=Caerostris extrusa TaxID=172846 RepID=A0AAV4Q445_CAEEX|nr:hypothetical protein CEXT_577601 [Caerostris extrusa]
MKNVQTEPSLKIQRITPLEEQITPTIHGKIMQIIHGRGWRVLGGVNHIQLSTVVYERGNVECIKPLRNDPVANM